MDLHATVKAGHGGEGRITGAERQLSKPEVFAESMVKEFYVLQAALTARIDPFSRAQNGWSDRLQSYAGRLIPRIAEMILDYTIMVAAGELRHALRRSECVPQGVPQGGGRRSSFEWCLDFNPLDLVLIASRAFNHFEWQSGYGGKNWGRIADAAINRLTNSRGFDNDIMFIDHCIDLSHNTSPYFDKYQSFIFKLECSTTYRQLLDLKAHCPLVEVITLPCSRRLRSLVNTGVEMGLFKQFFTSHHYETIVSRCEGRCVDELVTFDVAKMLNYVPVRWGSVPLPCVVLAVEFAEDGSNQEYMFECINCGWNGSNDQWYKSTKKVYGDTGVSPLLVYVALFLSPDPLVMFNSEDIMFVCPSCTWVQGLCDMTVKHNQPQEEECEDSEGETFDPSSDPSSKASQYEVTFNYSPAEGREETENVGTNQEQTKKSEKSEKSEEVEQVEGPSDKKWFSELQKLFD